MAATEPSTNGEKRDGRIKPGEVRNPNGRPKGARHRLGEAFLEAMRSSFDAKGQDAIDRVIEGKPDQFLKVIATLMPRELELGEETTEALADIILKRRQRVQEAGE